MCCFFVFDIATQFRAPSRSVSCDTGTVMEINLPESPRAASTPLKRPRCEVSAVDPSFHLNDSASSVNCSSSFTEVHPQKDKKYIVYEKQLLGLFRRCPVCTGRCVVNTTTIGTLLRVTQRCSCCEHYNEWSNQPMVNSIPAGNLQLCAAVLFTGSSFSQISKFLGAFNVQGLSKQTFYRHQAKLLIPTVSWQWQLEQADIIQEATESGPVTLGGDMRADSPGHSAKYGSYTMMDLKRNKVIQLVKQSVVNHLYWSASSSSSGEEAVAKWTSVANHIQNVNSHDNALFPSCLHAPLDGEQARQWLKPSTASCEKLTAILLAPRFVKDVEKISPQYHTSTLEAFHSLIIRFTPKSQVFSFKGMLSRLQIAAMHYNENAARSHAATATGELRYAVVYPKYKRGDYTVRALKINPTSCMSDIV
ncbi:uncharacterized protein [Nothobranchius furzeri]|uniref:uncharacterized protein n=1 Tax=Nothobranchius furzeri TaxID=105023 RepID=UPI0039047B6D